ncbi:hypothetical protein GCJ31_08890 [Campylobacter jejuni]|uniref:Uncharacterized protein n=1 Tax=Campylobacter coli TaxID=195 RepID=A0A5T1YRX4_CAMCO|nr:hypothetical protein [Campylobacter jejuni]EAL8417588.1 hypothetical protein [Campylobacter coli]EAJ8168378.1 hypothetical protein [Campylobacter jejuni]EAK5998725.1 hypothetical protein [Campylobacter jejuni]EBD1724538.1 hypothetical protein [Campylobacter jejuni]
MKKIISVLILALSLLNAKSFEESKKELENYSNSLQTLATISSISITKLLSSSSKLSSSFSLILQTTLSKIPKSLSVLI